MVDPQATPQAVRRVLLRRLWFPVVLLVTMWPAVFAAVILSDMEPSWWLLLVPHLVSAGVWWWTDRDDARNRRQFRAESRALADRVGRRRHGRPPSS